MPLFSGKSPALRSFCFSVFALLLLAALPSRGQSTTVVIDQVFGGGGGTTATSTYLYNQDYVELFNISTTNQDISGFSVQYASASGAAPSLTVVIPASTVLAPGQRYLIAGAASSVGGTLPVTPDLLSTLNMSATAGKVYLVNSSTALTAACPAVATGIIDAVGYGTTASCYEGTGATPAPSATTAAIRTAACTDTNQNASDFSVGTTPLPRNSTSTATPCGTVTPTSPSVSVTITPTSVVAGNTALIVGTVTKGTSTTISTVTADLTAFGGSATQTLYDDGTHGDATSGDGKYSYTLTVPANQAANTYTVTVKVTDGGSLTGTGTATLTTTAATISTNPTITLGAATPNPATSGSTVLLTAKVTGGTVPTSTGLTLTGNLSAFGGSTTQSFYDDGTHGDVTANDGTYSYSFTVPSGQAAASYTVNLSAADSILRTATGTITFSVQAPIAASATVAVTSSSSSIVAGNSVTLTATITGNKGTTLNGTVSFYNNGTLLGQGSAISGTSSSFTTTGLTVGSHIITASYTGDNTYPSVAATASTSTTVNVTAAPVPDFNLTVSNTAITLNDDQKSGIVTVAVSFINGFNSNVALTCSGLPAASRCTFSPSTLSATGVSIMTVYTNGASLAPHSSPFGKGSETVLAFTLLCMPFALRRKVRARLGAAGTMLGFLLLGAALFTATGCGSSNATPASTSTVTVTANGGTVTHTATFSLTAQ